MYGVNNVANTNVRFYCLKIFAAIENFIIIRTIFQNFRARTSYQLSIIAVIRGWAMWITLFIHVTHVHETIGDTAKICNIFEDIIEIQKMIRCPYPAIIIYVLKVIKLVKIEVLMYEYLVFVIYFTYVSETLKILASFDISQIATVGNFVSQSVYVVSTTKLIGFVTKAFQAAVIRRAEPYQARTTSTTHSHLDNEKEYLK